MKGAVKKTVGEVGESKKKNRGERMTVVCLE